jgi:hypothetical protein
MCHLFELTHVLPTCGKFAVSGSTIENKNETPNNHSTATDGKPPVSSSSFDVEICDCCGDYPCSCSWVDDDDDPFSDPIASSCSCGAYKWNVKLGKWLRVSDCCC